MLSQLAACCQRFSPIVGVEDSPDPDSLFLEITGLGHLFGGEAGLAEQVAAEFAARGLFVRMAIADTLGAAWAVAHFGPVPVVREKSPGSNEHCRLQIADCKLQIGDTRDAPAIRRGLASHQDSSQPPRRHAEVTLSTTETASKPQAPTTKNPFSICNLQFAIYNLQSAFFIVPPNQTLPALRGLPIEALRLPGPTVELLHSLGVRQIGQFELLPREELGCRFGPQLLRRWDQAVGLLSEPVPAQPLPPRFEASEELEYPTAHRQAVGLVLERLIARVAELLLRHGRGALRLECRLDCQSAGQVRFAVGLFHPSASPRHLLQLVGMHLEQLSIPSPVVALAVEASLTDRLDPRQEELFCDGPGRRGLRLLTALVDRLTSRLGRGSVLRARLVPEAQPELACQYDPLIGNPARSVWQRAGARGKGKLQSEQCKMKNEKCKLQIANWATSPPSSFILHPSSFVSHPSSFPPPRPLRLLRRPVLLAAMAVMPDGPPLAFRLRGREHRIARSWGPERIETGWWRGRPIGRDYFRVETTTGQRYWLFRRLADGRWFLHGRFE